MAYVPLWNYGVQTEGPNQHVSASARTWSWLEHHDRHCLGKVPYWLWGQAVPVEPLDNLGPCHQFDVHQILQCNVQCMYMYVHSFFPHISYHRYPSVINPFFLLDNPAKNDEFPSCLTSTGDFQAMFFCTSDCSGNMGRLRPQKTLQKPARFCSLWTESGTSRDPSRLIAMTRVLSLSTPKSARSWKSYLKRENGIVERLPKHNRSYLHEQPGWDEQLGFIYLHGKSAKQLKFSWQLVLLFIHLGATIWPSDSRHHEKNPTDRSGWWFAPCIFLGVATQPIHCFLCP